MPYSYKKAERLRKNNEFKSAMKGKRLSVDGLSLFYVANNIGNFRVGVSVSRKLGNAVQRNRLKRRLRSCISKAVGANAAGYDLVFVARPDLADIGYEDMLRTVEKVLRKSVLR